MRSRVALASVLAAAGCLSRPNSHAPGDGASTGDGSADGVSTVHCAGQPYGSAGTLAMLPSPVADPVERFDQLELMVSVHQANGDDYLYKSSRRSSTTEVYTGYVPEIEPPGSVHHPVLSADGRVLLYLFTISGPTPSTQVYQVQRADLASPFLGLAPVVGLDSDLIAITASPDSNTLYYVDGGHRVWAARRLSPDAPFKKDNVSLLAGVTEIAIAPDELELLALSNAQVQYDRYKRPNKDPSTTFTMDTPNVISGIGRPSFSPDSQRLYYTIGATSAQVHFLSRTCP